MEKTFEDFYDLVLIKNNRKFLFYSIRITFRGGMPDFKLTIISQLSYFQEPTGRYIQFVHYVFNVKS